MGDVAVAHFSGLPTDHAFVERSRDNISEELIFHGVLAEKCLVVGTRAIIKVRKSMRVGVVGPHHSKRLGLIVHFFDEPDVALLFGGWFDRVIVKTDHGLASSKKLIASPYCQC